MNFFSHLIRPLLLVLALLLSACGAGVDDTSITTDSGANAVSTSTAMSSGQTEQPATALAEPTQVAQVAAPSTDSAPATDSAAPAAAEITPSPIAESAAVDLTRLPVGDGNYSTTGPAVGRVWACNPPNANIGGASADGPWIRTDGTFDFTAKAVVDGEITWPHQLTITLQGDRRVITGNGLPDHTTGTYPISPADDAYQYDHNPNSISAQSVLYDLPANPALAAQTSCVPGGAIGITTSGVVFFNALDGPGRDAVAHETQDKCQAHPEITGQYHYHNISTCLTAGDSGGAHSPLIGYAFDGFGIYAHYGRNGVTITNADLDECHGHTHAIEWDGKTVEMYHYHATWEYPYTLGCYRGTPSVSGAGQLPQGQPPAPGQGQGPDLAAAAAQLGITESQLRDALGPPPPDLAAAAARLGVTEAQLRAALGVP